MRAQARHVDLLQRRALLPVCGAALGLWPLASALAQSTPALAPAPDHDRIAALLRAGAVVLALRHANAPGTFDPPEFDLTRCATQRNLDDAGRAESARLGAWFRARALTPAAVRSSPWCRCMDTARGAFGSAQAWSALGSPRPLDPEQRNHHLTELRQALAAASTQRGRFEVWVTHNFVLQALAGEPVAQAQALLLRAGPDGAVQVLARAALA